MFNDNDRVIALILLFVEIPLCLKVNLKKKPLFFSWDKDREGDWELGIFSFFFFGSPGGAINSIVVVI